MWEQIAIAISQSIGQKFVGDRIQSKSGGCINQTAKISDGDRHYFVKTNQASLLEMFIAEAIALQQIYDTHTIRVPKPICWGIVEDTAYLVMENLELGTKQNWEIMGRNLAAMHKVTSDRGFGWEHNNTIGSTPQINNWTEDWIKFWIEYRLGFQISLAKRKGWICNVSEQDFYATIPSLFRDYQPQPSMVHGDLWSGNAAFVESEPVIFDPALYFGDREVDLAMTELFGGFPSHFYQAYQAAYPLNQGYQKRKNLYNLYHILNHFNLFSGSYGSQANRMITDIAK
jgi:fructosamine-3-kinase